MSERSGVQFPVVLSTHIISFMNNFIDGKSFVFKSKQREDRTDQEETTDASSHIRHSVAIPYPVPQKNLTVQVNKISIIAKQCFDAVRFILKVVL